MDNIGDIVKDVIGQISRQKVDRLSQIEKTWQNALHNEEAKHVKIEGIKDGKIFVLVDSPGWMFQMKTRQNKILKEIQKHISDITNISFRIGKIS